MGFSVAIKMSLSFLNKNNLYWLGVTELDSWVVAQGLVTAHKGLGYDNCVTSIGNKKGDNL